MSIVGPIFHHARTRPDAPAIIVADRTIPYRDLAAIVRRTAAHLTMLGLGGGDCIGLCLKDDPWHLILLLAAAQVGAVAVPLDWRAKPAENARLAAALGLNAVVAASDLRSDASCPVIVLDNAWDRAVGDATPHAETIRDWNAPFVIAASSGSTGVAKFTVMTQLQYYFAIAGLFELTPLIGPHRFLCTLPLFYAGGRANCLGHLLRGDGVILYPSLFRPDEYVEVAARSGASVSLIVPSIVRQLLTIGGDGMLLPAMAALVTGGAPFHAEEKRQALARLTPNFFDRYGTAETLTIASLHPRDIATKAESVGRSHSLAEIEIVDEADRPLPSGAVGRLRYRSPGMATPLAGAEANFKDGWFYPGEIARLDDTGYIFIEGRSAEVIIRGGAKIYPAEVESALAEHPAVVEVAVAGFPSANNDQDVVAFAVVRRAVTTGELIAHCRARLTPHKVPRQIVIVTQLPKNAAGKIDKLALAPLRDGTRQK